MRVTVGGRRTSLRLCMYVCTKPIVLHVGVGVYRYRTVLVVVVAVVVGFTVRRRAVRVQCLVSSVRCGGYPERRTVTLRTTCFHIRPIVERFFSNAPFSFSFSFPAPAPEPAAGAVAARSWLGRGSSTAEPKYDDRSEPLGLAGSDPPPLPLPLRAQGTVNVLRSLTIEPIEPTDAIDDAVSSARSGGGRGNCIAPS